MAEKRYLFDDFVLEPGNRSLTRSGAPVAVSGRYFDALTLLVAEAGQLVTKDRFMEDIWGGAAVTDEALTQCIRSLRRTLGDSAANPRFIQTLPGHGYRFIAEVVTGAPNSPETDGTPSQTQRHLSGVIPVAAGGALAGLAGGIAYGALVSAGAAGAGAGAISAVLVVAAVCTAVGLLAGAGVGLGIAMSGLFPGPGWLRCLAGGALGGCLTGSLTKLIGVDALNLLFGVGLPGMTGGGEGLLLGAATGLAVHLARPGIVRWPGYVKLAAAVAAGLGAGLTIHMLGGRLMAGSLQLLLEAAAQSRLDLSALGRMTGEADFGPLARGAATMVEAALFTGLIALTCLAVQQRKS